MKLVGELTRVNLTVTGEPQKIAAACQALAGVHQASWAEQRLTALVDDSNLVLPRLFETVAALGARITAVNVQEPNLEAVFLHLTGRALRD